MDTSADLLRSARLSAGLTQTEVARRGGIGQGVVSAYESGRREPSLPTLRRLVEATGHRLEVRALPLDEGDLRRRVLERRDALVAEAESRGVTHLRLFGSVARGDHRQDSDVDLLARLPAGMTLWSLAEAEEALAGIVGAPVDLVPDTDLKPGVRANVLADAVTL